MADIDLTNDFMMKPMLKYYSNWKFSFLMGFFNFFFVKLRNLDKENLLQMN